MYKITSLADLKERAQKQDGCRCFILGIKSNMQVWYWEESNTWDVHNSVDGSEWEDVGLDVLMAEINIVKALDAGALYAYN